MRGQSAEMMFDGGAGDVLAAGVVQDVERQDLGGCPRVEHALSEAHAIDPIAPRPSTTSVPPSGTSAYSTACQVVGSTSDRYT